MKCPANAAEAFIYLASAVARRMMEINPALNPDEAAVRAGDYTMCKLIAERPDLARKCATALFVKAHEAGASVMVPEGAITPRR